MVSHTVMPFSDRVIDEALTRAGHQCECDRHGHWHSPGRCKLLLVTGQIYARHRLPPDRAGEGADNCEILCQFCYEKLEGGGA